MNNKYPIATATTVKQFVKDYAFLSNFTLCRIEFEGLIFPSAEHAYQSQKMFKSWYEYDSWISTCQNPNFTPAQIKKLSRKIALRIDWDLWKIDVMGRVVFDKFNQNENLKTLLLQTGDMKLEEGNTWKDTYWGIDLHTGHGENNLGKILMVVREKLKTK